MGKKENLLDVGQLSQLLNIKKQTIYGYVFRRKIPFVKIESNLRFRKLEIEEWIEERTVKEIK